LVKLGQYCHLGCSDICRRQNNCADRFYPNRVPTTSHFLPALEGGGASFSTIRGRLQQPDTQDRSLLREQEPADPEFAKDGTRALGTDKPLQDEFHRGGVLIGGKIHLIGAPSTSSRRQRL